MNMLGFRRLWLDDIQFKATPVKPILGTNLQLFAFEPRVHEAS